MARRQLSRRARQLRDDIVEDVTLRIARDIFRVQCAALGEKPEKVEAILRGPDAEFVLVRPREIAEGAVREAVDRGAALGARS